MMAIIMNIITISTVINCNLPTSMASLGTDVPALFPAMNLKRREHSSTLWGRLMVKLATACPGLVVSFKILPAESTRVMIKNSGILLLHTISTCRNLVEIGLNFKL